MADNPPPLKLRKLLEILHSSSSIVEAYLRINLRSPLQVIFNCFQHRGYTPLIIRI